MSKLKRSVDPTSLLADIISSDFDLSKFQQIDESDLAQPKNFLEWTTGRDFCNTTILPWQLDEGMRLFSDYCPPCSNPDFLKKPFYDQKIAEIQDNVRFLENGVCPKCKQNRLELFTLGDFHPTKPSIKNESIHALGQRGGKSKYIALGTSYQINRWLSLPSPLQYYNDLPAMEVITGTFSALTADQAELNLWIPFKGLYDQAPWFTKYNEFLKEHEKKLSIPLVDVKETYLFYYHKRLYTHYTGSGDRTKRGATRLFGAIDEIAFFNSEANSGAQKKVMDADKNYEAMSNSLLTIRQKAMQKLQAGFYNTPMAIMYNASSPHSAMDKIMRLVKSASNSPMAQAKHAATWECNPDFPTEDSTRKVAGNISEIDFQKNFGAIPPFSDSPYISEARVMEKLCDPSIQKIMEAHQQVYTDPMGDKYLYLEASGFRADKTIPRMLALDNGFKNNAFGAAVFCYNKDLKKPVLEFAMSLYPQPNNNMHIHFPMMFDKFILPIVRNFNILDVIYDRWQSLDQIQRLRDIKVNAHAHSLSFEKDFMPFKQQLLSGNMILPPAELKVVEVKAAANPLELTAANPITNLIWQTLTVREAGRKVMKPLEGDDDLFRAFVLGGSRFLQEEFKKKYSVMTGMQSAIDRAGNIGVYASNRGSGAIVPGTNQIENKATDYMVVRTTQRPVRRR